ncbi:helix-turn-helix domain-containing protein [Nocardioides sp. NBC_00368]|uniref:helix-turn-helix transcriptional regulator n=1 Tax=unclassified Nocardioides TaxID=2615069 RepID=UPI0025E8838B|nr:MULTISPECIES: helix-turn-helix domain-containing protein [unclassified Nocardioides]
MRALHDRMALTPEDAAVFMGIACATLKKWRGAGDGPAYVKVGSKIVYLVEDLESFLRAHRVA